MADTLQIVTMTKAEDIDMIKISSDLKLIINFSTPKKSRNYKSQWEVVNLAVRDSDEGRFWGQLAKT